MESACRLGFLVLCFSAIARCESSLSSEIRDFIGIGNSSDGSAPPETVFVFLNDGANYEGSAGAGLNDGDLLNVAGDLEQRDPSAIFAHYNGDNLITSHTSLFSDLDNTLGDTSFYALLDKIKSHQSQKRGSYADLIVIQSYPDGLQSDISKQCESSKKCKVVNTFLNDQSSEHSRFRRQAVGADTTTAAPPNVLTPQQRANIPLDSVAGFHLLFWTSLAIALAVWGTAYGMWHMDPGRDSIIYRMTSAQKFKKDK